MIDFGMYEIFRVFSDEVMLLSVAAIFFLFMAWAIVSISE